MKAAIKKLVTAFAAGLKPELDKLAEWGIMQVSDVDFVIQKLNLEPYAEMLVKNPNIGVIQTQVCFRMEDVESKVFHNGRGRVAHVCYLLFDRDGRLTALDSERRVDAVMDHWAHSEHAKTGEPFVAAMSACEKLAEDYYK